jgi:hypothetical protein
MDGKSVERWSTITIGETGLGQQGWGHSPLKVVWTHLVGEDKHAKCQVCLHCIGIFYHISVYMLCTLRNHICFITIFSLVVLKKIFADTWWGWQKKHVGRLLFYKPLYLRTSLILPHMLVCFVFFLTIKYVLGFMFFFSKKK